MLIGQVIGDITATQKHASHEGKKILLVQPLDLDGSYRGNPIVAVDSVTAGIGDRVLIVQDGFAAFTSVGLKIAPIDTAVIGIIDHIQLVSDVAVVPAQAAPAPAEPRPAPKKQSKKNRPQ
ncbi:EutN/CcmL family microcompartment protein [uncultured Paludibaculum sp.]|uniref:EutN/CcmL family microcompartment protein n=1 Tax=uncultured Paludibaculum sp. TaxID=1765020 RepID=UPI002AAC3E00|nr:EutN/CcmL family microcompartment protein [uncultured Paludibaculum sp.]